MSKRKRQTNPKRLQARSAAQIHPETALVSMRVPASPPPFAPVGTALAQNASLTQTGELLSYDESLLDRARTQWQFGDWSRLAPLSATDLEHHPQRAKLALFAAAGHHQLGHHDARRFTHLVHEWSLDRAQIGRVLISGAARC